MYVHSNIRTYVHEGGIGSSWSRCLQIFVCLVQCVCNTTEEGSSWLSKRLVNKNLLASEFHKIYQYSVYVCMYCM